MRRPVARWIIGALLLGAVLIMPWRRPLAAIQRPFVAAGTWIGSYASGLLAAGARVRQLQDQLAALAVDRAALERMKTDDDDLRARLTFAARTKDKLVSADIVAREAGTQADVFAIDRGRRDGLAVGMPAIVGDGVLAGKVLTVSDDGATIAAVTDRGAATAVSLLNGTRTIGLATGLDGALMTLEYIPKDEVVNVNDLVVTSGLEDTVPSGLVVGIVNAVISKETEPFKQAVIQPLADVRRIDSVSLIVGRLP